MFNQSDKLQSFHIIENSASKNLILWTFPSLSDDLAQYLLSKTFAFDEDATYICLKRKHTWINIKLWKEAFEKTFTFILLTNDYAPSKYDFLCDIFVINYRKNNNPTELVRLYLNVYSKGKCEIQNNGNLIIFRATQHETANIKDLILNFRSEIIVLYIAILLKCKIVVHHRNVTQLQKALGTIVKFVSKRNVIDYLYPFVETPQKEILEQPYYMIGTNNDLKQNKIPYDAFVDVNNFEIILSSNSKDVLVVDQEQQKLANYLIGLAESDLTDAEVAENIDRKTQELFKILHDLGSDFKGTICIKYEDIENSPYSNSMKKLLTKLAVAEKTLML